jgi:hypothetical protein
LRQRRGAQASGISCGMPLEVIVRMLWLAPPVLFTAGLGFSWPKNHDTFGGTPRRELFVDARVGYPTEPNMAAGLRLRGSHMKIDWSDIGAPAPYDEYSDRFELYTLELGAFYEVGTRYVTVMGWLGVHTAHVDAAYYHYTYDDSAEYSYRESFFSGPALALGLSLGVNVFNVGRYRVTMFGEVGVTSEVALTNKSFGGHSYTYAPLSLGVAVRF